MASATPRNGRTAEMTAADTAEVDSADPDDRPDSPRSSEAAPAREQDPSRPAPRPHPPAESEQDDAEAGPGKREQAGRRSTAALTLTLLVVLVVLGGAVWSGITWNRARVLDGSREQALTAAKDAALHLTSIDFRHADTDVRKVLERSTGEFAGLFRQNLDSYTKIVQEGQVVTTGKVVEAGVEKADAHSARILLAVQSEVRNKQAPQGEPRGYRMVATMQNQGADQWRVAKVEFVA